MHDPPHPGEIIRVLCLDPLRISATRAARAQGVSRTTLSAILNERAGIRPEMAVRPSYAFDTPAEISLNRQTRIDYWTAEQSRIDLKVERVSAAWSIQTHPRDSNSGTRHFPFRRGTGCPGS